MINDVDDASNSSEEGELMNNMFTEVDNQSNDFYFKRIIVQEPTFNDQQYTQVLFIYSLSDIHEFKSKYVFPGILSIDAHLPYLFNIGMCVLLWYYMGFASSRIIIECYDMNDEIRLFWEEFYNAILLEFKYKHLSVGNIELVASYQSGSSSSGGRNDSPLFEYTESVICHPLPSTPLSSSSFTDNNKKMIICPLGGKIHLS